jgi:hypothetical protein
MVRNEATLLVWLVLLLSPPLVCAQAMHDHKTTRTDTAADTEKYPSLPKPGEKVPLDPGHSFTYGFDRPPKLGTVIVKVQVLTTAGQPDTSFTVQADADMPMMRGAHSTGFREFKLSKRGDYLLPVTLVMPGEWEIRFLFSKDGAPVFRGSHVFSF